MFHVLYLNADPIECAKEHTDDHVKVQCLRIAQILSYLHYKMDGRKDKAEGLYRIAQLNQDDGRFYKWATRNTINYRWLMNHFKALLDEHQYRFDKPHVSASVAEVMKNWEIPTSRLDPKAFSIPPCYLDRKYQVDANKKSVQDFNHYDLLERPASSLNSYRNWYDAHYQGREFFTKREIPAWSKYHIAMAEINRTRRAPRPGRVGQTTRPRRLTNNDLATPNEWAAMPVVEQ